jgi:hypothetical protein
MKYFKIALLTAISPLAMVALGLDGKIVSYRPHAIAIDQ